MCDDLIENEWNMIGIEIEHTRKSKNEGTASISNDSEISASVSASIWTD